MASFQLQYNGITMSPTSYYRVFEITGLFDVDLRHSEDLLTGGDGGNIWASNDDMRRIGVSGIIYGKTQDDFYNAIKELTNAFRKTSSALPLTVTLPNGDSKILNAKVYTEPKIVLDNKKVNSAFYRLSLVSEDPSYLSNQTFTESIGLLTGGGGAIPTAIPMSLASGTGGQITINYTGNTTYPTIEILGPAENATVENRTTQTQFQIATTITSGETVTIQETNSGISVISNLNGNYQSYLVGDVIPLVDGANDIRFSAVTYDPITLLTLTWQEKSNIPIS